MNNTIAAICKNIDENPEDKLLLGILADLYEEEGNPIANGLRWLQTKKIKIGQHEGGKICDFFLFDFTEDEDFPYWWFSCLSGLKELWGGFDNRQNQLDGYAKYSTIHEAILGLANAYVKVNP